MLSLCFGKISRFPVFSLTGIFFPFSLFSLCRGYPVQSFLVERTLRSVSCSESFHQLVTTGMRTVVLTSPPPQQTTPLPVDSLKELITREQHIWQESKELSPTPPNPRSLMKKTLLKQPQKLEGFCLPCLEVGWGGGGWGALPL